jgi:hypothetical protein
MKDLDAGSAIGAGGWDSRFAVAVAVVSLDEIAAALIDTNGDGADVDLDQYERDVDGSWREIGSGSAGEEGSSWSPRMAATWGRAAPGETIEIGYQGDRRLIIASATGWWLFIAPSTNSLDDVPRWLNQR